MKKNILSDDDNDKKIKKDDQLNEEWSNPDVLDSNLIKEEIISFFDWKRKIIIFFSSIVVPCLLLGVIYSGLNYYGNKQEIKGETIYNKSLDLDQKINQKKEGLIEILSFQKRLKVVAVLLNEHIYWNNFFDFLEKHVIDDVYFVNFSGDINGEYGIEAIGKEYKNIVEQVEAFRIDTLIEKAEVKEGRITEGKDSDGVKFNLNLIINPEILKKID